MKNKSSLYGSLTLLIASIIWGSAFVGQEIAGKYVGAFTVNGIRFIIGGFVLLPFIVISTLIKKKRGTYTPLTKEEKKKLLIGGTLCGIALAIASTLQQMGIGSFHGIEASTSSKAGFITALYILFVPILSLLFKKKIRLAFWGCIAVALAGFSLLCFDGTSFYLASGDAFVFASSIAFAIQIMLIDKFVTSTNGVLLSCIEFFTTGIICTILMLIFEMPSAEGLELAFPSILYIGVFSCGIAYTLQVLGQQKTPPSLATLIMSLEAVFALITGMIFDFANNKPTLLEAIGSALIFTAVIVAQFLPEPKTKEKK